MKNIALLHGKRGDAHKLRKCAVFVDSQRAITGIQVSFSSDSEL